MKFRWWFVPLYPTVMLATIASLLVLVFYKPRSIRLRQGTLEVVAGTFERGGKQMTRIWGRPDGQSWGAPVIFLASERLRDDLDLGVHERVHAAHGLILNGVAHALLVPIGAIVWGWPGAIAATLAAQATFGAAYGGHFLAEWAMQGFGPWFPAYMRIWSERIAYRIQDEFRDGKHPDAWGG